jgi:hypothetical protein
MRRKFFENYFIRIEHWSFFFKHINKTRNIPIFWLIRCKVPVMQNFRKTLFGDFLAWLNRAHRVTSRNIIFNIFERSFLKKTRENRWKKSTKVYKKSITPNLSRLDSLNI